MMSNIHFQSQSVRIIDQGQPPLGKLGSRYWDGTSDDRRLDWVDAGLIGSNEDITILGWFRPEYVNYPAASWSVLWSEDTTFQHYFAWDDQGGGEGILNVGGDIQFPAGEQVPDLTWCQFALSFDESAATATYYWRAVEGIGDAGGSEVGQWHSLTGLDITVLGTISFFGDSFDESISGWSFRWKIIGAALTIDEIEYELEHHGTLRPTRLIAQMSDIRGDDFERDVGPNRSNFTLVGTGVDPIWDDPPSMLLDFSLGLEDELGVTPVVGGATDQLNLLTAGEYGAMNVLSGGMR